MTRVEGVISSGSGFDASLVKHSTNPFTDDSGAPFFPGSLNVIVDTPIRFVNPKVVKVNAGNRTYTAARLNGLPVVVSHRYPLKPPARRRILVFSTVKLRDSLNLQDGSRVALEFEDDALGTVSLRDRLMLARHELVIAAAAKYRRAKRQFFDTIRVMVDNTNI